MEGKKHKHERLKKIKLGQSCKKKMIIRYFESVRVLRKVVGLTYASFFFF